MQALTGTLTLMLSLVWLVQDVVNYVFAPGKGLLVALFGSFRAVDICKDVVQMICAKCKGVRVLRALDGGGAVQKGVDIDKEPCRGVAGLWKPLELLLTAITQ